MSTVDQKRGWTESLAAAEAFRDLFTGAFERWEFAGSIRRRCREVGDAEHVVIPRIVDRAGDDLFGGAKPVNLLWERADALVASGKVSRHLYANGQRWGLKYRGVDFGYLGLITLNEIFCADESNWGPTLAIRTGPADFSKQLVTGLLRNGHRNKEGAVWRCAPCDCRRDTSCKRCDGTGLVPGERISVPDEATYFKLAGVAFAKPEDRR
jgi:DNA polymerase/3'-5' exonuclease PolX